MQSPNSNILAPSILAGDHGDLKSGIRDIEDAAMPWVHLDIMDGHFVPNLTFGPQTVRALRQTTKLFFDVHLMLDNPHRFIEPFVDAGADQISIHAEPDYPVMETLEQIRSHNRSAGIVINPDTPAEAVRPYLNVCDIVLLMTVEPGFGGQSFRHDVLNKIETIAGWREESGLRFRIEVDGGIDLKTAPLCTQRGVDTLVAGTSFFKAEDRRRFAEQLTGQQ